MHLTKKLAVLVIGAALAGASFAQDAGKYGTAKFESYTDIESVKQLKAVFDANFVDPGAIKRVLDSTGSLMSAANEFGPHDFEPAKVVIVSHGPEIVVFARKNYEKYKDLVDRAASFTQQGVRIDLCRNAIAAAGFAPQDMQGFVTIVPSGPYALAYWQAKGYSLNAVGATMPIVGNWADLGDRK